MINDPVKKTILFYWCRVSAISYQRIGSRFFNSKMGSFVFSAISFQLPASSERKESRYKYNLPDGCQGLAFSNQLPATRFAAYLCNLKRVFRPVNPKKLKRMDSVILLTHHETTWHAMDRMSLKKIFYFPQQETGRRR